MLPTRLPVPLPGGSETVPGERSDVRPFSQWTELPYSGAALPATALRMTVPGFYFGTSEALDALTSLWIRKEDGTALGEVVLAFLYVEGVYTGEFAVIGSGQTTGTANFGVDLSPGDVVQVFVTGPNQAVVSGILRTPTRLFRLLPSPLGKVWVLSNGAWAAPPIPSVRAAGVWETSTELHATPAGTWSRLL